MDNSTVAQIAPSGSFGNVISTIHCRQSAAAAERRPVAERTLHERTGARSRARDIIIQRRNVEGGGRRDDLGPDLLPRRGRRPGLVPRRQLELRRVGQYGTVLFAETYQNDFSIARTQLALDVVGPRTARPAARSWMDRTRPAFRGTSGSSNGRRRPEALYVSTPGFTRGDTTQTVVTAALSSDLGNYGLTLPTAKDGIGVAFGAEYRQEGLHFRDRHGVHHRRPRRPGRHDARR